VLREIAREHQHATYGVAPAALVEIAADCIEKPIVIPDRVVALPICSVMQRR